MPAPVHYVHTRSQVADLLEAVRRVDAVALDTEFVGESRYEPLLCLVQVATGEGIWIVDPLPIGNLSALWEALTDPDRELVTLAAREELRFCLRYAGRVPDRLLDLQIAAGMVGWGYPLSHTNLVRKSIGVQLSGSETFTDWRQRPLSARQLEYAADDVRYLLPVRDRLMDEIRRLDREPWVRGECRRLAERVHPVEQEERWQRLPGAAGLDRRALAVLRELWRWRDEEARQGDSPVRRIMRDEMLVEIARRKPSGSADLFALRGLERTAARNHGPAIMRAVQAGMEVPEAALPASLRRSDPPQVGILSQILSLAANSLAAKHRVDPALLATASDLQDVVRWRLGVLKVEPPVFTGWRGEILREPLCRILDGKSAIRVGDVRSEVPLEFE